jgi:hypothetical protein
MMGLTTDPMRQQNEAVATFADRLFADHNRRFADVYAFGAKLMREHELRERKPGQQIVREPVGERNRKIARILARDGESCCYCGKPLGEDMTLEHRVAKSRGGSDDLANLKLAHARCNREVGNLPPDMKDELAKRNQLNTPREPGAGNSSRSDK